MEKNVYDARGRQESIFRLAAWDNEALLHMVTYRMLIFAAIISAILYFASLASSSYTIYFRISLLAVWVLFSPQLFSVAKGLVVMATKGMVFGHLNKSYLGSLEVDYRRYAPFRAVPYAAMAVWAIGFLAIAYMWFA